MSKVRLSAAARAFVVIMLAGVFAAGLAWAGAPLPVVEDANASDEDEFFSAAYKALPTDPSKAMYVRTGGNVTVEPGKITLAGGRFTVGMPEDRAATTGSDTQAGGALDLSRPYRIILEVLDVQKFEGNTRIQVYVDNNTVNAANSIHGGSSRIYNEDAGNIRPGQTIVITSSLGTANSFLQLRAESGASITLKSFRIEYQ